MKKIETERLVLKSFTEKNITSEYLSWLNNKELMKYSEQRHYTHTRESCLSYLHSFTGTQNLFLAVYLKKNNLHIGNLNAYVDIPNKVADMGILIGDDSVKKMGIGLEAWIAFMAGLFLKRDMRKITAGTMSINTAMVNIMKNSSMEFEGKKTSQFLVDNQPVDAVYYALFKEQFFKKHKSSFPKFD